MRRIALILILLFVALWGKAQVLENYDGKWSNATEQSVLGSIGQKQVNLLINTFPQSYFQFKVPRNSTLFVDGKLWDLIQNDTTFFIATADLKKEFESKCAADATFNADVEARLRWWYMHSDYADKRYLEYPIYRLTP